MLRINWLGRVVCVAVVCVVLVDSARAGVAFQWEFTTAYVEVGRDSSSVDFDWSVPEWDDEDDQWCMEAAVEVGGYGSGYTELEAWYSTNPTTGVVVFELEAEAGMTAEEPPVGSTNYCFNRIYFQLMTNISDQPYQLDLDYDLDIPGEPWVTQNGHYVNSYDQQTLLQPSDNSYVLLWGEIDYRCSLDFQGWGSVGGCAGTEVALTLTPVPEPATLSLLALGGVALLRRSL